MVSDQSQRARDESPEHARIKESSQYFRKMEYLIEFKRLMGEGEAPRNILLLPGWSNINVWRGVIFVEEGPYHDGVFRFTIDLPDTYPLHPPQIRLQTDCYHPLINASGTFVLPPRPFDESISSSEANKLAIALHYFADSFLWTSLGSLQEHLVPNKDALALLRRDRAAFQNLAQQSADLSNADDILFEDFATDNDIHFAPLKPAQQDLIDEEVAYYMSKEERGEDAPLVSPYKGSSLTAKIRDFSAGLNRLNKLGLSPSKLKSKQAGRFDANPFV